MKISVSNKISLFRLGLSIYMRSVGEAFYRHSVAHENAYLVAVREFYKASGYLTEQERFEVFENGIVPAWAMNVFREIELEFFGRSTL